MASSGQNADITIKKEWPSWTVIKIKSMTSNCYCIHPVKLLKFVFNVMVGLAGCWEGFGAEISFLICSCSRLTRFCFTADSSLILRSADMDMTARNCSGYWGPNFVSLCRAWSWRAWDDWLAAWREGGSSRNEMRSGTNIATNVIPARK
jgi:hypothetical protein